ATRRGPTEALPSRSARLEVSSSAIGGDGQLPAEFTCDGAGVSPPLAWSGAPAGTASYALSLWHDSPDGVKSYWVVHGIPASVTALPKAATGIGVEGLNGRRRTGYDPMCSRGPGSKTYHVSIYAISKTARLPADGVTRDDLLQAIDGAVLAEGQLTFTYTR
ncbi:YbhB/YbcL family Raf kinase inhibitor-like protein, partial [bacterium]|nr:YbhB/YbcL family Raf kinase inhibitor-like protein [bacterium]